MAMCDYITCDKCGCKAIYDGDDAIAKRWQIGDGLIFVLCCNCAKTHTYKLIERAESFLESKRAEVKDGK